MTCSSATAQHPTPLHVFQLHCRHLPPCYEASIATLHHDQPRRFVVVQDHLVPAVSPELPHGVTPLDKPGDSGFELFKPPATSRRRDPKCFCVLVLPL